MIKSSARVKSSKILEVHSDKPLWNKSQKNRKKRGIEEKNVFLQREAFEKIF